MRHLSIQTVSNAEYQLYTTAQNSRPTVVFSMVHLAPCQATKFRICGGFRGPKVSDNLSDPDNGRLQRFCTTILVRSLSNFWRTSDDYSTTMGVSSASQVLHRLVGLSLDHVVNAAKQHAEKNG